MTRSVANRTTALLLAAALGMAASNADAERADRDKPTQIEGKKCVSEELTQLSVCSGDVVLTRGTLRITGERLEVRETPEGYRQATVVAAPGGLATFRQRQDATRPGVEEYVEGVAERIEYDERTETVRLIERAVWRRLENEQPRDEIAGQRIVYDSASSTYSVAGGADGDGRVRLILSPRQDGSPQPAPPAKLTPSPELPPPAKK